MKKLLAFTLIIAICTSFTSKKARPFPEFSSHLNTGQAFTHQSLKGKRTLVVFCWLGCGGTTMLMTKLNLMKKKGLLPFEVLAIMQNTDEQVRQFNGPADTTDYSKLRKQIGMKPIEFPIIAVGQRGSTEALHKKTWEAMKIEYSPTLMYVDENGQIAAAPSGFDYTMQGIFHKKQNYILGLAPKEWNIEVPKKDEARITYTVNGKKKEV